MTIDQYSRFPRALSPGDTLMVVSPAGPVDGKKLQVGADRLKSWGYNVEIAPHALCRKGYLAGSDEDRAEDLINAFKDPAVNGVICSRGGYGSARLLSRLPFPEFKKLQPKIFIGFSDIGALLIQLWNKSGWVGFSGPQVAMALGGDITPRTAKHLRGMVDGSWRELKWDSDAEIVLKPIRPGGCSGEILPCCLSILVSLIGTPYFPDLSNVILCLEDLNEPPYRLDRMLWQLFSAVSLEGLKGVILGRFLWDHVDIADDVGDMLNKFTPQLSFPIWSGLPYGHVNDRLTVPTGISVTLSGDGTLEIDNK